MSADQHVAARGRRQTAFKATLQICWMAVLLGVAIAHAHPAIAQSGHDVIRPSLVYLVAKAQVASGPSASQTVESHGTGFLVSEDGLVLTTYHLVSALGDIVPATLTIEGRVKAKNAVSNKATVVDGSANVDLLLLKLPPDVDSYSKVQLGNARSHNDADPIYTSGFPRSINYRTQEGTIEAREGPGGYLWATSLNFEEGQSGSPVYNKAGLVLGVVKGDQGNLHYIIPIEFADPLLTQVRLREIEKSIADISRRLKILEEAAGR
jgi:S1-C subfamily serine protease